MKRPPRVWHLLSNRWNSAITEYALSAVKALELVGVENLFSPLKDSPAERRAVKLQAKVESLPSFGLSAVPQCRRIFRRFFPDAVFVYGGAESFLLHFLPRTARVRFRGNELVPTSMTNIIQRLSMLHVDKIVVPGRPLLDACSGIFGREKVTSIILGCDSTTFHHIDGIRQTERPEMLIFGRFDPIKGHKEFLKLFRIMLDRWPEQAPRPLLTIAGEPANTSAESLRSAAKECGIDDVHLKIKTGRFENVADMMSSATLGVVSSLGSEQICRVAEEFLLCGTPVAVSGVGSLEDVLFNGAGISYKGFHANETAVLLNQTLLKSFAEPENLRSERAAAAAELFSLETMAGALTHAAKLMSNK